MPRGAAAHQEGQHLALAPLFALDAALAPGQADAGLPLFGLAAFPQRLEDAAQEAGAFGEARPGGPLGPGCRQRRVQRLQPFQVRRPRGTRPGARRPPRILASEEGDAPESVGDRRHHMAHKNL